MTKRKGLGAVRRSTITISLVVETSDGDQGIEAVADAIDRVLDNGTLQDAIVEQLELTENVNMEIVSALSGAPT